MMGRPQTRARAALQATATLMDEAGRVSVAAVASMMCVQPRSARRCLSALAAVGLARCLGDGGWVVTSTGRTESLGEGGPKVTADAANLQRRVGGLQRSNLEIQQQRDAARARVRELETAAWSASRARAKNPIVLALRVDLAHAADCTIAGCKRCDRILDRLEEAAPGYGVESDLEAQLERAEALEAAARKMVEVGRMAPSTVGRAHAARSAWAQLQLALEGSHGTPA